MSTEGARIAARESGRGDKFADYVRDRDKTFPGIAAAMADQWGT